MAPPAVQLFAGGGPVPQSMLDVVRDPSTKRFLGPVDAHLQEEALERFYSIPQDIPEAEQDTALAQRLGGLLTVVVDTGVLAEHPLLQGRLVVDADFTGEGAEDRHGHGTVVALLVSAVRFWPLMSLKVISGAGHGSPDSLVRALDYIRTYKQARPETVVVANLSLGMYSRRWMFFRCRGGCAICRAARRLAETGVQVVAAAGNTPGRTACPATLAVRGGVENVYAVEAPDVPTTGIGTVQGSGKAPTFAPLQ